MLRFSKLVVLVTTLALVLFSAVQPPTAHAQATIAKGNIAGVISDPTGAVVAGAKITITNSGTGATLNFVTTGVGSFNSGGVEPGDYVVRVEAQGFKTTNVSTFVQVGSATPVNIKLELGTGAQVVEVVSAAVAVNTEQSTVGGVLTRSQIDSLPFNGRNFLDLAQLEPGVQIQDGSNFDPTKGGFTGISIGGRAGRTTRIELDGVDISDETVGTAATNVSAGAIAEFQVSQSSLDLSTELTSSGSVNVITRGGTNRFHGEGFYLYRDDDVAANFNGGQSLPFQRNQFGGSMGGPIIKDRLFLFGNIERIKQDLNAPVNVAPPLDSFGGSEGTPFRDVTALGKMDVVLPNGVRAFYRINYENQDGTNDFGVFSHNTFVNTNNSPSHAGGLDFTTGRFNHSIRLGYLVFHNAIADASSRLPDLIPGALIRVGTLQLGANLLAPQATFQRNTQLKYDGSLTWGAHTLQYGASFNRIRGGGFASFFGLAPRIRNFNGAGDIDDAGDPTLDPIIGASFPGGDTNPLNYTVSQIVLGNGQGFFTDLPEFGFPGGGQFDNRVQWYLGDAWKFRSNLTFNFGVRYVRDTGRTNSEVAPPTCADLNVTAFLPVPVCPAGGLLGDLFGPGLGARVRQDNNNFGGNLGFAWDPWKKGKTIIRGGAGLFYENAVFNNILFGRPGLLKNGLFNQTPVLCPGGDVPFPGGVSVSQTPGGFDIASLICGQRIGDVASEIIALQNQFQAATTAGGPQANGSFLGNNLGPDAAGVSFFHPNYRTPYSIQMNIGVQHEFWPGTVLTVDYLRNVSLRFLIGVDVNRVGDASLLNVTAAQNAIAATTPGGTFAPADIDAAILAGATIDDFADNGLDSGNSFFSGLPSSFFGLAPDDGAAFPGERPEVGANHMLQSVGRSVYSALQVKFQSKVSSPVWGVKRLNVQAAYALSKFESLNGDQDFINNAIDNRNVLRFFGRTAFDRTHQFSLGPIIETDPAITKVPLKISFISHINSPLPITLFVRDPGTRSGEIFHTDFEGDGSTGDVLPGTNIGDFGHAISGIGDLNSTIDGFNSTLLGTLTPAGQALVDAGLFTQAQLVSLGATIDSGRRATGAGACTGIVGVVFAPGDPCPIAPALPDQFGNDWLTTFDLRFAVPIKIREKVTIEPSVSVFNLFNAANFNTFPDGRISGVLGAGSGQLNSRLNTSPADAAIARDQFRAIQTPSVFNLGSARQVEFGIRLTW